MIPADAADPLILEFRRAVRAGLAAVPASPARSTPPPSTPAVTCSNSALRPAAKRRPPVHSRHGDLADEQHQRARSTAHEDPAEGFRRLTSEDTTQDRLDIRSYIDTARKHGQDALTVLRATFTGNPWRPPAAGLSP